MAQCLRYYVMSGHEDISHTHTLSHDARVVCAGTMQCDGLVIVWRHMNRQVCNEPGAFLRRRIGIGTFAVLIRPGVEHNTVGSEHLAAHMHRLLHVWYRLLVQ